MTQQPSSIVSSLGWLLAVGGGTATVATTAISGFLLFLVRAHPQTRQRAPGDLPPFLQPLFQHPAAVLMFFVLVSVLALVAGIGLLRGRRFGRTLALAFCTALSAWFCAVAVPASWYPVFSPAVFGTAIMRSARAFLALAVTGLSAGVLAFTAWLFRALSGTEFR